MNDEDITKNPFYGYYKSRGLIKYSVILLDKLIILAERAFLYFIKTKKRKEIQLSDLKKEVNLREFRIAKELGFETAVTTYCVPENKSTIFCLPRLSITDHYGLKGIEIRINGLSNFLGKQFG